MAASACCFCVGIFSSTMRLMFLWSSMCFSSGRVIWDTKTLGLYCVINSKHDLRWRNILHVTWPYSSSNIAPVYSVTNQNRVLMSCDTNGPIRKAYGHIPFWWHHEKPQRPGTEFNGVCARAGSQARGDRDFFCARVKKGFFGGFLISKKRGTKKWDKKWLKMRFIVMKSKMFTSYNRTKIYTESKKHVTFRFSFYYMKYMK